MELIKYAKMSTQIFHGMGWNIWNEAAMQKTGFYIFQLEWNGIKVKNQELHIPFWNGMEWNKKARACARALVYKTV